jgi:hypothetical protein
MHTTLRSIARPLVVVKRKIEEVKNILASVIAMAGVPKKGLRREYNRNQTDCLSVRVNPIRVCYNDYLAVLGLLVLGCQPQIGVDTGPPTPSIGNVAALTHEVSLTLSGTKSDRSSIFINGVELVARDSLLTWNAVVDLPVEGTNMFELKALDDRGQLSDPLLVPIVRDTTPPSPPTVNPSTSPAATNPVMLSGTKEAGALVRLDGRRIVPASSSTTWTYQATLAVGPNDLQLTAVDAAGNESNPTTVSVTLTTACPSPRPVFPLDREALVWGAAFRWQAPSTAPSDGYRFELSASPAFDVMVDTVALAGTVYSPNTPTPPRGGYFWRVGGIEGSCVSYGLTRMVRIGSTSGDIDGDGFADIVVGATGDDSRDENAGAANVYRGGASPDVQPAVVFIGEHRRDAFGNRAAKVGDVDGDGYVDVLVGSYLFDVDENHQDDTGRAYLFWGGPTPATEPGVVFTGEGPKANFGLWVAGVGDVNGDGYPDLAVGAPGTKVTATCGGTSAVLPAVGRVYVYFGGPRATVDAKADAVLTGETTLSPGNPMSTCRQGDQFGARLAGAGDVNGDGFGDILVGAYRYDLGVNPSDPTVGVDAGRAYLFYGGPWLVGLGANQADVIFTGSATDGWFGAAVAGAGDTNGDGFADFLIGAPLEDKSNGTSIDAGTVSWYLGGPNLAPLDPTKFKTLEGFNPGDNFGVSVASAGDVDRDGFADLVVGAFLEDGFVAGVGAVPDAGSARLFRGDLSPSGAVAATYTGETVSEKDQFGWAVAGAGDVNGDGKGDLIVGTDHNDAGGGDAGRAYLFLGADPPPSKNAGGADRLLTGRRNGDGLGISVD